MKKLIPTIGAITGLLIGMPCLNAGGPELKIERSVKVSFDSEVGKSYNAYSTTDVAKQKWELLGGPADGTGEKIVFFYQSDDDQKVFFKVDEADLDSSNKDKLLARVGEIERKVDNMLLFDGWKMFGSSHLIKDINDNLLDYDLDRYNGRDYSNTVYGHLMFDGSSEVQINLNKSKFESCIFSSVNFGGLNLETVSFKESSGRLYFYKCNLNKSNFEEVRFYGAYFGDCTLINANFNNAIFDVKEKYFGGTDHLFYRCNLSGATGLDGIINNPRYKFKETIMPDGTLRDDP
ncbi:pentapeptide repeat-containing protein [bacterium]|nr:pentapeptide repeat-containing protein [bacterium]